MLKKEYLYGFDDVSIEPYYMSEIESRKDIEDINFKEDEFSLVDCISIVTDKEFQKVILIELLAIVYTDNVMHEAEKEIIEASDTINCFISKLNSAMDYSSSAIEQSQNASIKLEEITDEFDEIIEELEQQAQQDTEGAADGIITLRTPKGTIKPDSSASGINSVAQRIRLPHRLSLCLNITKFDHLLCKVWATYRTICPCQHFLDIYWHPQSLKSLAHEPHPRFSSELPRHEPLLECINGFIMHGGVVLREVC